MPANMVVLVGKFVRFNLDNSISIIVGDKLATIATPEKMYDQCRNILEDGDYIGIKGHIEFEPNVMVVADKISTMKDPKNKGGENNGNV